MKEWVLSIGAVIIFITVIGFVLPNGKMGNYIKNLLNFLLMIVIINPIFNFNFEDDGFETASSEVVIQEEYLEFVYEKRKDAIIQSVVDVAKEVGIENVGVEFFYDIGKNGEFSTKKLEINLQNSVINKDKENINIIDELTKSISEKLLISSDLIYFIK